jgi:hypothetical protein
MGANAQIAVPAFTAGQVLTAAQQTQINTGIPVFATTTTRDAAFGGTGEKTLAEGQFAYIEATNATQYYDGAAWQPVGATGLSVVVAETVFTTAATIQVDNCFTSAYTNYLILFRFTAFSTSGNNVSYRESIGGTPNTTNYAFDALTQTSSTVGGFQNLSDSTFRFSQTSSNGAFAEIKAFGPQLAANTFLNGISYGNNIQQYNSARHADTTQYDGFHIHLGSGTMTGTYTVYGYSK